jgi:hypothetical protein
VDIAGKDCTRPTTRLLTHARVRRPVPAAVLALHLQEAIQGRTLIMSGIRALLQAVRAPAPRTWCRLLLRLATTSLAAEASSMSGSDLS